MSQRIEYGAIRCENTVTFVKPPALPVYTVATAPAATLGLVAIFSDGAEGNICLAFADGTNWLRSDTNTAISDS
jgi:hypothetical protein